MMAGSIALAVMLLAPFARADVAETVHHVDDDIETYVRAAAGQQQQQQLLLLLLAAGKQQRQLHRLMIDKRFLLLIHHLCLLIYPSLCPFP